MEKIAEKVLSGRFIFTVLTGLVFVWTVYTKQLENEQIYATITLVVAFYFNKIRKEENEENHS